MLIDFTLFLQMFHTVWKINNDTETENIIVLLRLNSFYEILN